MRLHPLLFAAVLPGMAQAQLFTFGVKGGVPAQMPLGPSDSRMPFVLGPTVTLRLFSRLSLETGVLFHRMGENSDSGAFLFPENAVTLTYSTEKGRALELPFLAKVHLRTGHHNWSPFLTLGPTLRRTSFDARLLSTVVGGPPATYTPLPAYDSSKRANWNVDPAAGAGVDFKAGRFHLEPEVRYSYWGAGTNLPVRKNQVNFLLGFRF